MSRVEAIVFDIGNVLIEWDVRALYRTMFDDESDMERFLSHVWTPMENLRCDRGTPFAEVIAETIARHPGYEPEIRAAWDRWIETVPGEVPGALELLADLAAANMPMYGLSNFSAETFPLIRNTYPHFDYLEDIVISGDHPPLAKPDPEIFELLCTRAGISPATTVFIDDVDVNTVAAAELGFITVTFIDTPSLRSELARLGVSGVS